VQGCRGWLALGVGPKRGLTLGVGEPRMPHLPVVTPPLFHPLQAKGQAALTREEKVKRQRSLDAAGVPSFHKLSQAGLGS
jgi:hypothetical protein